MNSQRTFEHLQVQEVGDGVFAVSPTESGCAGANAGIVDLGDRTLIVDTLLTPVACRELLDIAQRLTGRRVSVAVNTHYHSDHCWGNQECDNGVEIIASAGTRALLLKAGPTEIDWYRQTGPGEIARIDAQLALLEGNAVDAATQRRRRLETGRRFYLAALAAIDTLTLRAPTLTFADRITVHGSLRSVEIICCGAGHTGSDSVVFAPDAGVLFAGDLVTVAAHPYLPDGELEGWQNALNALDALHPTLIVPGHGNMGDAAALVEMRVYLDIVSLLAVGALLRDRLSPAGEGDAPASTPIPARFAHWEFATFFAQNLRFLFQEYRKASTL